MWCRACSRSPQNALRPGEFRKSFMKTSPDPWVDGAECLGVVMLGAFGTEWWRQYRSLCSHPYLFPLSGSSQSAATLVDVSVRAVSNPFCSLTPYPVSFSLWSPSPDPPPQPPHSSGTCYCAWRCHVCPHQAWSPGKLELLGPPHCLVMSMESSHFLWSK